MSLLIAIVGCRRLLTRLATARATWGAAPPAGVEIVYFVGAGPDPVPDWVTALDAPDDYPSLPLKVHAVHRHLAAAKCDHVFKCDDDTYVVIDRLMAAATRLGPGDFLGAAAFHPEFASGGAGYLIPKAASAALAQLAPPDPGPEDVVFSQRLRTLGYGFQPSEALRYASEPQDLPTADNDIITCHWLTPLRMRQLHDHLAGLVRDPQRAEACFVAAHGAWSGQVRLYPDGFFVGGAAAPDGLWRREGDRLKLSWFSWPEDVLELQGATWRNANLSLQPA